MDPIAETHRQDMLNAMMEAVQRGDVPAFFAFYPEFERVDQGRSRMQLPQLYLAEGFCFHCSKPWTLHGISIDVNDPVTEADCVETHVLAGQCEAHETCRCFMATGREPRCQLCGASFERCTCGEPAPGPCLEPIVTLQWLNGAS